MSNTKERKRESPGGGDDGAKAPQGLVSAEEMREHSRKQREKERAAILADAERSGRDAATVYRDKHGRRLEMLEEMMKTDKKALTANQQVIEWGKQGIAQKENELKKRLEQDKAAAKPIARYHDDEDLNDELRQRSRWGDPMLQYISQNRELDRPVDNESVSSVSSYSDDEQPAPKSVAAVPEEGLRYATLPQGAKSAQIAVSLAATPADVPKVPMDVWIKTKPTIGPKPKYRGVYPPNRFNITPGFRSNGFEVRWFEKQKESKMHTERAEQWGMEEM